MIAWGNRLAGADSNYVPSFEDLRDIYVYLRSSRKLLTALGRGDRLLSDILYQLEYVFSEGFGSAPHLKTIVEKLTNVGLGPDITYMDRTIELNLLTMPKNETLAEKRGKTYLKQGARLTRSRNWQYRLEVAIDEALHHAWYPMFGTYTVDPKTLPEGCLSPDDLWTKTPAWDRFVKKFKTEIADASGHGRRPATWPPGREFFKYFALIEHGASGNHPHIHVIWLCKNIPPTWRIDPNTNDATQMEVDIPAASALWPHGIQRKTMGLFIVGSWFTKHWKLPRKSEIVPGKIGDAGAIAGYLGKYLTKGETKKWKHRVKATSNLGIEKLTNALQNERSLKLLLTLACRPMKYTVSMKLQQATTCPLSLLREKSKQELIRRLHCTKSIRARNFLMDRWTKRPSEFFTKYMKNVKDGQKPWSVTPEQRYSFYTLMLEEVKLTVHSSRRLKKALDWLCYNEGVRQRAAPYVLLKGE